MRRGFILVSVLFALVLLTALASGGFFEALQELRIGRNVAAEIVLRSAAESGIAAALGAWDPRLNGALPVGGTVRLPGAAPPAITGAVEVRRLTDRLLLVRSSASDVQGTARVVLMVARLAAPELAAAAVRARVADAATLARADGIDRNPTGWGCPPTADTVSGLVLEPGASDSAFFRFGPMDWAGLVAWAQAVPNGGDSLAVAYQPGDTVLAGVRWTGTLVVDGDLVLRSGAELVGLIIVRGALRIAAGGAAVYGAVVASQVVVDQSVNQQQVTFGYSSCSASRAALSRALPVPLPGAPIWGVY